MPAGNRNSAASAHITLMGVLALPAFFQLATFRRAMRAKVSLSSTPITPRKGISAASSRARPMPAPASKKVNSSGLVSGRLLRHRSISCRNTEGATPKYAVACRSCLWPLFRCLPATSPLVRTPNSASKGCFNNPSATVSPGSRLRFGGLIAFLVIVPRAASSPLSSALASQAARSVPHRHAMVANCLFSTVRSPLFPPVT